MTWDPDRYLTYADERGRPFVDLVSRIDADGPRTVVDLGCGPGNLTRLLADRWPDAEIVGVDSSPEMIAKARETATDIDFEIADLRDWSPGGLVAEEARDEPSRRVDVLVSNATLQWVPGHLDLLPRLVDAVAPGGWLAFQVPGNFDQPNHVILRELAAEPAYADHTRGLEHPSSHAPEVYLRALAELGCAVDVWETTYLHVLQGEDPVFTWISSTGARPVLQALPPDLLESFTEEFKRRLRAAYPADDHGVVLPFRRIFAVAKLPTGNVGA